MLGLQYLLSFLQFDDGSTIAFGFLTFMELWIPTWRIATQLLLSLAFPIGIYLHFREQARRHVFLNLSWAIFAAAAATTYMFYESGPRIKHGNFLWTSYSAIFLLMFASTFFLMEQYALERRRKLGDGDSVNRPLTLRTALKATLFGLHVIFGIISFFRFQSSLVF